MDLLAGYGADSDGEDAKGAKVTGALGGSAGGFVQVRGASSSQDKADEELVNLGVLPNPFADDELVCTRPPAGKRPAPAITGHTLVMPPQPSKTAKKSNATGPSPPRAASQLMLPPQLSGRSNAVTEDLEKMFTRRAVPAAGKAPGTLTPDAAPCHPPSE